MTGRVDLYGAYARFTDPCRRPSAGRSRIAYLAEK
jgi:hypothetical protein